MTVALFNNEIKSKRFFLSFARKEGRMKNFWKIAQPLGLLCFLGAFIVAALNALAIIAASLGFMQPFNYYQYVKVPLWSVALPAVGILALLPLALRRAFTFGPEPEEEKVVEPRDWRRDVDRWRHRLHFRHA
jgi:hypothetical protein